MEKSCNHFINYCESNSYFQSRISQTGSQGKVEICIGFGNKQSFYSQVAHSVYFYQRFPRHINVSKVYLTTISCVPEIPAKTPVGLRFPGHQL